MKTRLQLQGELLTLSAEKNTRLYTGMFDALVKVMKNEGIQGLQGGLSAGIAYQIVMNGMRLGLYDYVNKHVRTSGAEDPFFFLKNLTLAGSAGGLGAFLGNPFFLVKVRLQTANRAVPATGVGVGPVGVQYDYKGVYDGLNKIIHKDGWRALFKGSSAASLRVAVGSGVQIASYENIKREYSSGKHFPAISGSLLHMMSSATAATVVSLCMNPLDVITTRLYNQVDGRYTSAIDCAVQTFKTEGMRGFFKGLLPQYMRLAPHTVLTFVVWERLKTFFN